MHLRGGNVMENRLDRLEQRLEELESKNRANTYIQIKRKQMV